MKITKIVLHTDEGTAIEIEVDDAEWQQSAGICQVNKVGHPTPGFEYNRQMVMTLKAWKGCASYEKFEKETERNEPFTHRGFS